MQETAALKTLPLLEKAQQHVLTLHQRKHNARLIFHSYAQTTTIIREVEKLAALTNASEKVKEIALLTAWFYNTGCLDNYQKPLEYATTYAQGFLKKIQYANTALVVQSLKNTHQQVAKTAVDALVIDARSVTIFGAAFNEQTALWRVEEELILGKSIAKADWQQQMMDALLRVKFYTSHGKIHFAPLVAQNIIKQKSKIDKQAPTEILVPAETKPFEQIEGGKTSRGVQTLFRTNYRTHINLSAIADNKANIMISVNSILISVLITILTWRNITQTNPKVVMPAVVFLITALSSLIAAVLSARPKVTSFNKNETQLDTVKRNVLFFGNFVHLPVEQYEEIMDDLLHDESLLYTNLSRDLYFLGKVLAQKYFYLTISYNIFMVGFILSVLLFLFFLFL